MASVDHSTSDDAIEATVKIPFDTAVESRTPDDGTEFRLDSTFESDSFQSAFLGCTASIGPTEWYADYGGSTVESIFEEYPVFWQVVEGSDLKGISIGRPVEGVDG